MPKNIKIDAFEFFLPSSDGKIFPFLEPCFDSDRNMTMIHDSADMRQPDVLAFMSGLSHISDWLNC